jgi:hypothetical protein
MTDRERTESFLPKRVSGDTEEKSGLDAKTKPPEGSNANVTPPDSAVPKQLTSEEQMALYEKELKENDWGHQPC